MNSKSKDGPNESSVCDHGITISTYKDGISCRQNTCPAIRQTREMTSYNDQESKVETVRAPNPSSDKCISRESAQWYVIELKVKKSAQRCTFHRFILAGTQGRPETYSILGPYSCCFSRLAKGPVGFTRSIVVSVNILVIW